MKGLEMGISFLWIFTCAASFILLALPNECDGTLAASGPNVCSRTQRTVYGVAYRLATRQAHRAVYFCCPGWKQQGQGCPTVCDDWTYGSNCRNTCLCNQTQTERCHKMTGKCFCKRGFTGPHCDKQINKNRLVIEFIAERCRMEY